LAEAVSTGIAVGLTGTGVLVGVLAVAGGASSAAPAEWETLILWVIAAVGATAGLALELSVPRRGVGAGALAGPLACVIAVIGLITYTNLDGRPSIGRGFSAVAPPLGLLGSKPLVRLVTSVGQPPLALWLVLAVLAAPAALLTWRKEQRLRRTWPAAAAMGLVVSLALVTVRGPLVGLASAPNPAVAEAQQYLTTVGPDAARRYDAVGEAVRLIGADTSSDGPARATRIRNEVLIPLRALLADAESYQPATSQTRSVHLALVAVLRTAVEKWETVAASFQNGDAAALADAGAKQGEENRFLLTWQQGLRELQATVTKG
jgi:hypothetical protein